MEWRLKILLATLVLAPLKALAGPPFITDDPLPVEYRHIQIIPYAAAVQTKFGWITNSPGLEINYGLAPQLEVNTTLSYQHNYTDSSNPDVIETARGVGDTQVGLKYAFVTETATRPQIAFAPIYFIPTGNAKNTTGNGKSWTVLPIWLQKSWGEWTCYGGGGYALNSGTFMRNYYLGGIVLQKHLNDKWLLGGELFSQTASSHFIGPFTLLNVGGNYIFTSSLQALFSIGHSITGAKVLTTYLGLQWNP